MRQRTLRKSNLHYCHSVLPTLLMKKRLSRDNHIIKQLKRFVMWVIKFESNKARTDWSFISEVVLWLYSRILTITHQRHLLVGQNTDTISRVKLQGYSINTWCIRSEVKWMKCVVEKTPCTWNTWWEREGVGERKGGAWDLYRRSLYLRHRIELY